LHLKKQLASQKFHEDEKQSHYMVACEGSGIQILIPGLNKCLDKAGDYVEK
jgi:hypothetical protein